MARPGRDHPAARPQLAVLHRLRSADVSWAWYADLWFDLLERAIPW
jgi:hypothetical protein